MNILKQESCLSIDLEKSEVKGRTRITVSLQDTNKLSLYCKQLEIQKI